MEREQDAHIVPISNQSRQVQQFSVDEGEELSAQPQKELNLKPLLRTFQRKALIIIGIIGLVGAGVYYKISARPENISRRFSDTSGTRDNGGQNC